MLIVLFLLITFAICQPSAMEGTYVAFYKGTTCGGEVESYYDFSHYYDSCYDVNDFPSRRFLEQDPTHLKLTCDGTTTTLKGYSDPDCLNFLEAYIDENQLSCQDISTPTLSGSVKGICSHPIPTGEGDDWWMVNLYISSAQIQCSSDANIRYGVGMKQDSCTLFSMDSLVTIKSPVCSLTGTVMTLHNTTDCTGTTTEGPDGTGIITLSDTCSDVSGSGDFYGKIVKCSSSNSIIFSVFSLLVIAMSLV